MMMKYGGALPTDVSEDFTSLTMYKSHDNNLFMKIMPVYMAIHESKNNEEPKNKRRYSNYNG
jgi:hypothetical protein